MGTVYRALDERLIGFIRSQPVFFVATALSIDAASGGGHVNVSPKGYREGPLPQQARSAELLPER